MRAMTCALLAGNLALASGLAQAESPFPPGGGATINLREYWILAEIHNPKTEERVALRVDCTDQSPILCKGGPDSTGTLVAKLEQLCGSTFGEPIEGWPTFVRAEIGPFYPGIVEYMASGAGGFALANIAKRIPLDTLLSEPAPFSELRRKEGFSTRIASTRPDCRRFAGSDIRLTMWLVTPDELAERDAAEAGLGAGKVAPAPPRLKRGRR